MSILHSFKSIKLTVVLLIGDFTNISKKNKPIIWRILEVKLI